MFTHIMKLKIIFFQKKKQKNDKNNILIDGLAFLEEVVNNIMKETNKYKKNRKIYISTSNEYLLNKNIINNKKLFEETKIEKEKKIINFLLNGYPYIYKPKHKIADNLKYSKLNSHNNKKKNINNDSQKEYIEQLDNFINFK